MATAIKIGAISFTSKSKAVVYLAKRYPKLSQREMAVKAGVSDVCVHLVLKKLGVLRKAAKVVVTVETVAPTAPTVTE